MGSKRRYANHIVPILQAENDRLDAKLYIEPFVGGANIIDKIQCEHRIGYDRSDTLIALLQLAAEDFSKIPTDGSREMWDKGKGYVKDGIMPDNMSLADIGAIEFFASFSNGGFPRGYAKNSDTRNYYKEEQKFLACNWGWYGENDGWFPAGCFDALTGGVNENTVYSYSSMKKINSTELDEDDGTANNYQYNKEIFVNLKPNNL